MGYKLRRRMREALGPNIVGLQRAIALEIADDASDKTRESYATLEELARWTAAKDTAVVRNALKRLAAAGWEFRVPLGKGKDGRVLYAIPGTRMTFLVPEFEGVAHAPSPEVDEEEQGLAEGGAGATPSEDKGEQGLPIGGAGAPSEGAGAPPFSSIPSVPSSISSVGSDAEAADEQLCIVAAAAEAENEKAAPKKRRASPDTTAPDEFPITDGMREWASKNGFTDPRHIAGQTEQFLDHHRAKGTKFRDWTAAWRTWMRRSRDYAPRGSQQQTTVGSHNSEWMHQ